MGNAPYGPSWSSARSFIGRLRHPWLRLAAETFLPGPLQASRCAVSTCDWKALPGSPSRDSSEASEGAVSTCDRKNLCGTLESREHALSERAAGTLLL